MTATEYPTSLEGLDYASFASNVTSQAGEDGIIDALLERLPDRDLWCVEFGAWDGLVASNSASLISAGYSAVLIEASDKKFAALSRRYRENTDVTTVCAMVGWAGERRLDAILAETRIPLDFDVLSIDIDGNDYHVWKAVEVYRPKIVVIEYNPTIANGIEFVQPADESVRQGASITSLTNLAKEKGYELVAATEFNAFFARSDLFAEFGVVDNAVKTLRTDTTWQTQIFFGYDGKALLRGGKGLYWHGFTVPQQIRMVPRIFVGFPGDFGFVRLSVLRIWSGFHRLRRRRRPWSTKP